MWQGPSTEIQPMHSSQASAEKPGYTYLLNRPRDSLLLCPLAAATIRPLYPPGVLSLGWLHRRSQILQHPSSLLLLNQVCQSSQPRRFEETRSYRSACRGRLQRSLILVPTPRLTRYANMANEGTIVLELGLQDAPTSQAAPGLETEDRSQCR